MSPRAQPMMRLALLSFAVVAALLAAIWASPSGGAPASAQPVPVASMSLAKVCSPEAAVGGLVQYTFTVTNTGDQGLDLVSVIDPPNLGDITSSFAAHLDPGQGDQVFKFYIVQESDARPLVNTVTATYVADDGTVLVLAATCSVDVPHLTITKTATFNPDGTTTLTFTLTNDGTEPVRRFIVWDSVLGDITSQFPLELAVGEAVVVQITVAGEVCENTVTAIYQSVPRSTTVTAIAECTTNGQLTFLDAVQVDDAGNLFTTAPITFHVCEGDVVATGCDGASPTHVATRNSNPSGPIPVNPGTHTVCVVEPAGFVADAECKKGDVPVGGSVSFTFITTPIPNGGGEGCTPGFWKNHLDAWGPTGFTPGDDFDTTFGVDLFDPDITLDDAINAKGGGVKKLARHGTAALLNAAHPDVDYPLSVAQVIAAVQAGDLDDIPDFNELSSTCPADSPANNTANNSSRNSIRG